MIVFRCTKRFSEKFRITLQTDIAHEPVTILGDWYFNFFTFARKHFIIGVSENSLLPVIITAKEIRTLPGRFRERLAEILQHLGIDQERIDRELEEMQPVAYGTTRSRTVLGCQNDYIRMLPYMLNGDAPATLLENALQLSKTPFKPIGYASPAHICVKLFARQVN